MDAVVSVVQEVNWFGFDEKSLSRWFNLAERPPAKVEFFRRGTNTYVGFTTPDVLTMEHGAYGFDLGNLRVTNGMYVGHRVLKLDTARRRAVVCRYGHPNTSEGVPVERPPLERDVTVDPGLAEMIEAQGLVPLGLYDCDYELVRQYHDAFAR